MRVKKPCDPDEDSAVFRQQEDFRDRSEGCDSVAE